MSTAQAGLAGAGRRPAGAHFATHRSFPLFG
jgi:hypothetical protein